MIHPLRLFLKYCFSEVIVKVTTKSDRDARLRTMSSDGMDLASGVAVAALDPQPGDHHIWR